VWRYNGKTQKCSVASDLGEKIEYLSRVGHRLDALETYFKNWRSVLEAAGVNLLQPTELSALARSLKHATVGAVCSPVEVRIRNASGEMTGLVDGQVVRQLPGVDFEDNEFVVIGMDVALGFVVVGNGSGTYRMLLVSGRDTGSVSFQATMIPTRPGATHVYSLDWDALARGEKAVTLKIDQDGDGVFERTLQVGSDFTGDELKYTIRATAGAGGAIAPSGAVAVIHGTDQTFTITPDEGHVIHDVLVDGSSVLGQVVMDGRVGTYRFANVTKDHTIHAVFAAVRPGTVVNHGPNPVPAEGCVFWFELPEGANSAKLLVYNVAGRLVAELPLDPATTRYPAAGRWRPVDKNGIPLANGPYIYVLVADDRVIGQGKMVIQR